MDVNTQSRDEPSSPRTSSSSSLSASAFMASAFASVSEMASKSILNSISSNQNSENSNLNSSAPLAEKDSDTNNNNNNKSVLFKAFSITKLTSSSSQNDPESPKSTSIFSDSLAAASSVITNFKNTFDSPYSSSENTNTLINNNNNNNNNNSTNYSINNNNNNNTFNIRNKPGPGFKSRSKNQKFKQNLFFQKLEAHSLSLSSAVFGNSYSENDTDLDKPFHDVNMLTQNNNRANSDSSSTNSLSGHSNNGSVKRKVKPPPGTIEYLVEPNDTIEKIALKWNTVPSEIQHLNRLATRVIFPGQVIFVPDPNYVPPPPPTTPPISPTKAQLPDSILNELNTLEQNKKSSTPQSASNNQSPGFNIFKWKASPAPKPGHVEKQKERLTSSLSEQISSNSPSNELKNNDDKRTSLTSRHTLTEEDAKKLDEECMQRFLKVNCKIVTRSKGCFDGVLIITPSAIMFDPFNVDSGKPAVRRNSSTNTSNIYDEASAIIPIEIISNVVMYEDLALKDVQEYFDYQQQIELIESETSLTEHNSKKSSDVSFNLNENENTDDNINDSNGTCNNDGETNNKNGENRDEVFLEDANNNSRNISKTESVDDQNTSKASISLNNSSLISCYLCIKVNKNKDFISCPLNRKMKNRLTSEFWFQINDNNTDKICAFFLEWKSDPTFSLNQENMPKGQFQLVKQDEKLADSMLENLLVKNASSNFLSKSFSSTNRLINKGISSFVKDWEIVNLRELELKLKQEIEIEKEYKTLPNLNQPSTILKEEHLRKLNVNLIPRAVGYNWTLAFSTELNGFSLSTMYRLLAEVESPCLVVVLDSNRNIFGGMSSCKLYPSEHYYGTGESFLYTFNPSFKIFKWTGENNFFIRGNTDGIGFGCAEGYHGLWFDGDLLNGHSQRSKTFDNEMLSSTEYFTITALEVWTFFD